MPKPSQILMACGLLHLSFASLSTIKYDIEHIAPHPKTEADAQKSLLTLQKDRAELQQLEKQIPDHMEVLVNNYYLQGLTQKASYYTPSILESVLQDIETYSALEASLQSLISQLKQPLPPKKPKTLSPLPWKAHAHPWPVSGKITHPFHHKDQGSLSSLMYDGILIGTSEKKAKAIESGKVVFASWIPYYGFTMIVDHGSHWYSIYGELTSFAFKVSDTVQRGEVIGDIQGELFLGLKQQSALLNPTTYLKKAP